MLSQSWQGRLAVWLLVLLALPARRADAASVEPAYTVETKGIEDGLPQSSVIALIQTRDGYLWLGTTKGLVRFDGHAFTVFNEFNTPGLPSDQIVFLFEDSHTNLWAGTDTAGLASIQHGQVRTVQAGSVGFGSKVVSAGEDPRGGVWFYTADAHLARYDQGTLTSVQMFPEPAISRWMAADRDGLIWLSEYEAGLNGTKAALVAFRANNFQATALAVEQQIQARRVDGILASRSGGLWRLLDGRVQKAAAGVKDFGPYPWTNATITATCEDADGNLVVGTLGDGLYWFDADGENHHLNHAQGLSSDFILSLCLDREGNLWVGTDGAGLNRVRRKQFLAPAALGSLPAQAAAVDATGGLWTAFNAHGVAYWASNTARPWPVGKGQNAWTVLVDHRQTVWAGTRGEGLFQWRQGQFVPDPGTAGVGQQIFALFEDATGQVWAGTQNGLGRWDGTAWKMFTTADGLPASPVRAVAQTAAGTLWVGTENGGLSQFQSGRCLPCPAGEAGPSGDDISALLVDHEDILWAGTAGHGLAACRNGHWTHYSSRDGLVSNSISYIIEDAAGNLWVGSNAGLMRLPKTADRLDLARLRTFGRADGLPTRECSSGSQPAACRMSDGTLWFPTAQGMVAVNPAALQPDRLAPQIRFESVRVDDHELKTNSLSTAWTPAVVVRPGAEHLEIHYTGLHFTAADAVRFRYRLEGHETQWTEAGADRVAHYYNLWPHHYRFLVMAANEDGVLTTEPSVLDITVQPLFWQTRTFLGGLVAFILIGVAGVVRYLSTQKLKREVALFKQQEALEKERSRIARDLHDQLGANLTQVALLGEMAKEDRELPEEVTAHADQILQTARETTHALDEIVWAVNPANDTLEGLVNYAVKYAQEYLALAGLRYRAEVPAQVPAVALPPEVRHNVFLAFKESVNNVVKHAQASEVWIRLHLDPGHFTFEIADNGRGLGHVDPARAKTRNGLRNLRKRLEEIHGVFTMTSGPAGGTMVRLTAPLAKTKVAPVN